MPKSRRLRATVICLTLVMLVATTSVDYTVERGDTLGGIARDHDVSLSELISENDISNPNLIHPGQVLKIPGEDGEPDVVHVVSRGETLGSIAKQYETSVSRLVEINSISNPNLILIGQQLVVSGQPSPGTNNGSSGSSSGSSSSSGRSGKYHVVQRGESLPSIAAKYPGVSPDGIATANGILNGIIYAGTRLFLDGPGFVAKGSAGQLSYTVTRGDRLGDIAATHNTTISRLVEINKIANPNLIRSGQTLVIPSGTSWVCPVSGSSYFNDWGFPRGGGTRFHEGNDLFVAAGAPIRAPVSGTVEFVTGSIGGNQFRLFGDDGVKYIGSHMSEFGKDGNVNAGDIIGYVGNTGNAKGTRSHLHFGMYKDDVVQNPYPTLIAHNC